MRRRNIALLLKTVKTAKLPKPKHTKKRTSSKPKQPGRKPRKIALALWALGSLCLILLLGQIISLVGGLYHPITPSFAQKNNFLRNPDFNINLVVKGSGVGLISLNQTSKKLTVIKIPDEAYLDLPKGYGSWPARSVFELGQAEAPPIGDKLLKASVTNLLGLPVDGVVVLKHNKATTSLDQLVSDLHKNPLALVSYYGAFDSDLTGKDLLSIAGQISTIREDRTKIIDLGSSSITESQLLPDSTRVLGIDNVKMDLFIRSNLKEASLAQFDGSIAIFNSTDHPGLAQAVAREITNMGGSVSSLGNIENNQKQTKITVSSENLKNTSAFLRLAHLFAPDCLKSKCEVSDSRVVESRAQINIVIGEDYYRQQTDRAFPF